ncbi:MAG: uridine-cytidine kinase [Arcicella sp.]|nr:uridine-cytidine kinase [Arcicella sp.]
MLTLRYNYFEIIIPQSLYFNILSELCRNSKTKFYQVKPNQKPFIIGITGGSASGKTMFLNQLLKSFLQDEICLISQDNYYRNRKDQEVDAHGYINFDDPKSLDLHQYALDVQTIHAGKSFQKLEYTFNNPNIVPTMMTFEPKPIIVVEGLFVLYYKEIADSLDLKIFIDAKCKLRLDRRIKRDGQERGYGEVEEVIYRWNNHVEPAFQKYVKPYRKHSDIVIPNNVHFEKGLEVLVGYLRSKI